jgi:epoxyqueuosine reductase
MTSPLDQRAASDASKDMGSPPALIAARLAAIPDVLEWAALPVAPPPHAEALREWLAAGLHGGPEGPLGFMDRHVELRCDPRKMEPWARSLVLLLLRPPAPLRPATAPASPDPSLDAEPARPGSPVVATRPAIAAYARGDDYHRTIPRLLAPLARELSERFGLRVRTFADSAPVSERDLAVAAGLGHRGRNTLLLHTEWGSHFLIGGFFTDAELRRTHPAPVDLCAHCDLCLRACPTQAILPAGWLDARRCLSAWTIEQAGPLTPEQAPQLQGNLFGCDLCQQVCPYNRRHLAEDVGDAFDLTLAEWESLLQPGGGWKSRFAHTPLARAGRAKLLRNLLALRTQQ